GTCRQTANDSCRSYPPLHQTRLDCRQSRGYSWRSADYPRRRYRTTDHLTLSHDLPHRAEGGRMPISCAVDSIPLDELATELLPAQVVIAIDEVDIEYLLWERRRAMNADPQHAAFPAMSSANERILPVVVLGDMVAPPGPYPLPLSNIRPGRSNRAI